MPAPVQHPRFAQPRLEEALADSPVTLIHGPRQCGKTTLARTLEGQRGYAYLTFDDPTTLASAREDPAGFVANLAGPVILDEVQRAPEVFSALKLAVDRRREPGRFVLTGSTNVLLLPRLSDSLAGRLALVRLHPLAQSELGGRPVPFLDNLFRGELRVRPGERLGTNLAARVVAGGYPAAVARSSQARRSAWYRDYIETLVQRDLRDIAKIRALDTMPRLLAAAASQTARLFNLTELASPFQLSRPTIQDYVTLLERLFLVDFLPAWHGNRLSRLVKTSKLHLGDAGLASALLGVDAAALAADRELLGQLLQTFVVQELRRHASWSEPPVTLHHYRDKDNYEVDVVLERGSRQLAGIEVKAGSTVTAADFRGLKRLADAAGERFVAGVVLFDGEQTARFGDRLQAVPLRALWEAGEG